MFLIIFFLSNYSFFRRKKETTDNSKKGRKEDKKHTEEELNRDKQKKVEVKTIIIEQSKSNPEFDTGSLVEQQKKDSFLIPLKIKNQIEKIILKLLYEEKAVKTLKSLNEKVLEVAAQQKITISEKVINSIINQMNKEQKIEFTQKEGWKIKI